MKASLQLRTTQQLNLTPQLQQALKMLQLSNLELQQEIQQQVEINPLLEASSNEEIDILDESTEENPNEFEWSHLYAWDSQYPLQFNESNKPYDTCTTMDLRDYLLWQLNLSPFSETDNLIAKTIIDAINDNGFLTLSLDELYHPLIQSIKDVEFATCEAVRHRIQRFDPVGCAAINLAETLTLQLQQLPIQTPGVTLALRIVQNDINLLANHNYKELQRRYHISEQNLATIIHTILCLHPTPGSIMQQSFSEFVIPDLIVKKRHGRWHAEINPQSLPHVGINQQYLGLLRQSKNHTDILFLRNYLQEARSFLKNIQNRQETLLIVANYIVQFQQEFFEVGAKSMKPLILKDVARKLQLHESTISRVTTQKFIHTAQGLFELKFFFSTPIISQTRQDSSKAIQALIKTLIARENPEHPLSDKKIAELFSQQGIQIARRTVTKYRELLGFASSCKRKLLH